MGYYVAIDAPHGKAATIVAAEESAKLASLTEASRAMKDPALGVVVVVNNGAFEAAGFAFNQAEFDHFTTNPEDDRPKEFVVMARYRAAFLSGYEI